MVTTVTTITVTTITSVTTTAVMSFTTVTGMAVVSMLCLFLATKQLAGVCDSGFPSRLSTFLSVSISPLLITFGVIVVAKIIEVLA